MLMRTFSFGLLVLFTAGVLASPAAAMIPDPARSSCSFPVGPELPCPDPIHVFVTLRDAFDVPVVMCSTSVTIVIESGGLEVGQVLTVGGVTDVNGAVELVFPDGIFGLA